MQRESRAIVTGATGGIGEAVARRLASDGRTVVLVGRSPVRLRQARERVVAAVPGADLHTEQADLSVLAEVRELCGRLAHQPPPDVVVSNAAVLAPIAEMTSEGLPRMLATNHLAPYLLLRFLAEALEGRAARFVVVGADPRGLTRTPVDLDDLGCQTGRGLGPLPSFRPFVGYARTKNMNAMFVYALARRLAGTRITVNGAHPGIVKGTGLGEETAGAFRAFVALQHRIPWRPGPDAGADTPAWLATSANLEGVTGGFFVRRRQVPTSAHTTDVERCDRLWDESARLAGIPVGPGVAA